MSKWTTPEGREGAVPRMPDPAADSGRVPASEWSTWVRELGRQQRRLREFLGLSQDQVAKLGGVSQGAVSRLETARGLATPMLVVLKVNAALAHEFRRLQPTLVGPELREAIELHAALSPFTGALDVKDIPRPDDPQLEELVRLYRQTPSRHRPAVLSVVRALVTGLARLTPIALVAISTAGAVASGLLPLPHPAAICTPAASNLKLTSF